MVRPTSPRRQQGVAAVFAAVSLLALLSATALAIDVGRLYTEKRNLQRLADLAALDAVRVASGCLIGATDFGAAEAEVRNSLARNGLRPGTSTQVLAGRKTLVDDHYEFRPTPVDQAPDSVQVQLTRPSPARILPFLAGEQGGNLQVRAAARAEVIAVRSFNQEFLAAATPDVVNALFGNRLASEVSIGLDGYRASAEATVIVRDVVEARTEAGVEVPDLFTETPLPGLLSRLTAALDAAGDAVAAQTVSALAAAAAAGGTTVGVVPAELLGLPPDAPEALYGNTVVPVADLLSGALNQAAAGGPITIPLPLPPPLGDDSELTLTPGNSTPDIFVPGFSGTTVDTTDSVVQLGGLARLDLRLANPITGEAIRLPVLIRAATADARITEVQCARRGLEKTTVSVRANGNGAVFAIGDTAGYDSATGALTVVPAELLRLPLSALDLDLPFGITLPVGIIGQNIGIGVAAGPVTLGDSSQRQLCFDGPPWNQPVQCDGSPARLGGAGTGQLLDLLQSPASNVQLRVLGLETLNLGPTLNALIEAALEEQLLAPLSDQINQVLNLLAAQIIPLLRGANLSLGDTEVKVNVAEVPPAIYAR